MNSIIGVELDKTKPKLNIKSFLVNKTFKWASFWGGTLLLLCCFLYMSYTQIQKHTIAQQYNLNLALESRIYDGLIFPRLSSLRKIDQFINQQVILQKQEVFAYNQSLQYSLANINVYNALGDIVLGAEHVELESFIKVKPPLRETLYADQGNNSLHIIIPTQRSGELSGWVSTQMPLDAITALFASIDVGKHGILAIRLDNTYSDLIHYPRLLPSSEQNYPKLLDSMVSTSNSGTLKSADYYDKKNRLYNYKRIGDTALYLVTGLAVKDYLAEWIIYVYIAIGLSGAMLFLVYWFNNKLGLSVKREYTALESLKLHEIQTKLLLDSIGQPIIIVNLDGGCRYLNKAAYKLTAIAQDVVDANYTLNELFGHNATFIPSLLDNINSAKEFSAELLEYTNDHGHTFSLEIRAYPNLQEQKLLGAFISVHDISEKKAAAEKLAYMAMHDPLTGLINRWKLTEEFDKAVAKASYTHQEVVLILLDLDNFKAINDSLGHGAGDLVLVEVAKRLQQFNNESHFISRLGGDEFLLLANTQGLAQLNILLKEMLFLFNTAFVIDDYQVVITPSIGVARYPEHGTSFEEMLKAADVALYDAKDSGKNAYSFYAPHMGEEGVRKLYVQTQLRQAFEQQDLYLDYQPQFDINSRKVVGVEALLRWKHADLGQVSPAEFIPAAERSGLIIPITQWILNQTCEQAAKWEAQYSQKIVLAINCSAHHFTQGCLVSDVKSALSESGLSPELLELEVTESALLESSEKVTTIISALKELGVKFAIDDFGTGYSNMAYLKQFAADKLKIDRSFISKLDSKSDVSILEAIITLAHNFNLIAIAEGVEMESELKTLQDNGCNQVQGFLLSKPISSDSIHSMLATQCNA
ncbi:EAL domain-containing protein [Pseudoalteromonas agarivorans]|uniref:EAL domain-containing protein n=1 Tax=Pseudoalteromonas agarivorans TaxID=176102 RepID=UPI002117B244|nr:EAL domain-containing protein [Pseudoalteromonas agarivorans]MCQ8820929.1 EAL domain-containing protein [Pseudoalteromonas agarivorans]